jgi:hypothetical protein
MSAPATSTDDGPASRAELHFSGEDFRPRAWLRLLRDLYCTIDRRTLGFSRILLGYLLLTDLIHRGAAWRDMYSSAGVLPTALHLQKPGAWGAFTIFNAFNTPPELQVLWAVMAVNAACLMIGYRTRLAQVVALVLHVGMNGRVLLIENGGYVVNNLLLLWTAFLPLGDRFSVDALLASLRRRRETTAADLNDRRGVLAPGVEAPHRSLAVLAVTLQIAAIYYFNVIHKTGPQWRNGTAVHFVLYVDRMATPIVSQVRDHLPNLVVIAMTRATMGFEAAIPVLLLQPLARTWARRGVVFMVCALHLAFGVTFVLGPFSWSACVFATLLFSREDWEVAIRTMRRPRRARTVHFDPVSGGALLACRVLKRLDRFELLTFRAREKLPLGLAVDGQTSRAGMVADVLEALPLGPIVAWIPRLPGIRGLLSAALGVVEHRDVSGFFGLAVDAPRTVTAAPEDPEVPPIPARVVVVSAAAVAGAVVLAVRLDAAWPGVLLVLGTVVAAAVASTWVVFPSVTLRLLRRVTFGGVRELVVLVMIVAAFNQGMLDLWCISKRLSVGQPEALRLLTQKMRFLQGWYMFSPNPVTEDGTIVVDALTADGRHVDPFTGKEPYWDVSARSLSLTQIWSDYFNRIQLPANAGYRDAMKDYLLRFPERTGRSQDAIASGDVYWVRENNPRWNEHTGYGYERVKLLSFESAGLPADRPRAVRDFTPVDP